MTRGPIPGTGPDNVSTLRMLMNATTGNDSTNKGHHQ